MRVYEYAKENDSSSKEILKCLQDAGFDVANHMAFLSDDEIEFLNQSLTAKDKKQRNNGAVPVVQAGTRAIEPAGPEVHVPGSASAPLPMSIQIVLEPMTVADLASALGKQANEVILLLLRWGVVAPKNRLLDEGVITRVAQHYGVVAKRPERKAEQKSGPVIHEHEKSVKRLPVVVVLGHVDHGKTTLLDFIRKTKVAAKEKGGITQHLGAYHVQTKHGGIIFLDTPGHEAFSKIRSRGLKVADVAVLVVAIDDGVMPQTIEAIKFAKEMQVPVIVAVNKVDKAGLDKLDVIRRQLTEQNLLPEEWGGQVVVVPISAKTGLGVDNLLEMVDLQAQLLELRADVNSPAQGYVLESKLQKGRGAIATVILQQGALRVGDYFVVGGVIAGKVSSLFDSYGKSLKQAEVSYPIQVAGFEELPNAGDFFEVVAKEQARKVKMQPKIAQRVVYKEKAINLVIKSDTNSSKEALEDAIKKLARKFDYTDFHIVFSGVGDISERDVQLASNTGSAIIGLHVKISSAAMSLAHQESVGVGLFDIIYKLLEDLERRAEALKEVKMIDKKIGEGVIRKVFDIKKIGIIAGCYVSDGIFSKNGKMVVWRGKHKIGSGSITSLQREGKNVKEIHAGFECAFMADSLTDFAVDDKVECYISAPDTRA